MKVEICQFGDPEVRSLRLSREGSLRKLYNPPRERRWLFALDPDTLVGCVVLQESDLQRRRSERCLITTISPT
jgi:hypothetical protein